LSRRFAPRLSKVLWAALCVLLPATVQADAVTDFG
jgi:hypothetical protein